MDVSPLFRLLLALAASALPGQPLAATTVEEAWISPADAGDELDSLATWPSPDGRLWLLATAKRSHRLVVFDGDDGRRLREFGGPGDGPGQFNRPNGLAVSGNLLFVAERDNHRVQVLSLPGLEPLGSFGQDELKAPYGLWLHADGDDASVVLVTDSFLADPATLTLPPREQLAERVKRYRVRHAGGQLQAEYLGAFGDTGEGALHMVESIAGDLAASRLLIAEEDTRVGSTLREYSLDGRYLGRSLPPFAADAEGVALWECGGQGYWLAVEQLRPTRFHLFGRHDLAPVTSFQGLQTGQTDGVALHRAATARFPGGVLYALHDDRAVAAFDLRELVRRLGLPASCSG